MKSKSDSIYLRRCHICGELTETSAEAHIEKCTHCNKVFARFHYFSDELSPVPTDSFLRPVYADSEYQPVIGLTAVWTPQ